MLTAARPGKINKQRLDSRFEYQHDAEPILYRLAHTASYQHANKHPVLADMLYMQATERPYYLTCLEL